MPLTVAHSKDIGTADHGDLSLELPWIAKIVT